MASHASAPRGAGERQARSHPAHAAPPGSLRRVHPEPAIPELPTEPVTLEAFREAMRRFATGVTVVSCTVHGEDHAMTANAFTSVSLDPLLVLVCVEKVARFHDAVLKAGSWAVSVLDESARDAAEWFATPGRPLKGQFAGFPYVRGQYTGAPLLRSALSTLECRTWATYDGGDHTIVVGDVLYATTDNRGGRPLVYYEGGYQALPRWT